MSSVEEVREAADSLGKFIVAVVKDNNPDDPEAVKAGRHVAFLISIALVDLHRLADAAERIARQTIRP